MKINLRTKTGWKRATNKALYICDIDGSRLWIAPDGRTVYCNEIHEVRGQKWTENN